jgi:catechol 2,3-dioxygenase-like lactoylglutathione lyase family enzyme
MTDAPTSATLVTGVDFVAVPARDFDASVDFYGKVLGLPFVKRWGGLIDSGVCHQAIFLDPAGNSLGLHHRYAERPA